MLRVEATVNEFLNWQKGAREKLSLIEHHKEEHLTIERGAVTFDSSITADLPTTELGRFKLENDFNSLKQGTLSCREHVTLIRDKSHELRQLGLPIAKAKIVCMLLLTLNNESLRNYIHHLSPSLPVDEFLRSILTYEKTMVRESPAIKVEATPALPITPVALVVEQYKPQATRAFTGKCFQCDKIGHRGSDCSS